MSYFVYLYINPNNNQQYFKENCNFSVAKGINRDVKFLSQTVIFLFQQRQAKDARHTQSIVSQFLIVQGGLLHCGTWFGPKLWACLVLLVKDSSTQDTFSRLTLLMQFFICLHFSIHSTVHPNLKQRSDSVDEKKQKHRNTCIKSVGVTTVALYLCKLISCCVVKCLCMSEAFPVFVVIIVGVITQKM